MVLLGLPAVKVLYLLMLASQSPMASTLLPSKPLHATTTPSITMPSRIAPHPYVPIVGVTSTAKASTSEMRTPTPSMSTDPKAIPSKWRKIIWTPVSSSPSSKLPSIVVPVLAVLADTLPEGVNCPGGCKHYQCRLCAFQHPNKDCMLMHIWQHLEIKVSCPMCGKGFQNAASVCKHRKKAHAIQIVESERE